MRWLRRTDDARRTKGDPPASYAQLEERLREQRGDYDDLVDVVTSLRKQCDNLIVANARLRTVVAEKTEYAEQLAAELAKAKRPERLDAAFGRTPIQFWICEIDGHTKVEWRGNVAHCTECGRSSADEVDEDVTRPYTEAYEAGDGR
jgi:hypothetical protein